MIAADLAAASRCSPCRWPGPSDVLTVTQLIAVELVVGVARVDLPADLHHPPARRRPGPGDDGGELAASGRRRRWRCSPARPSAARWCRCSPRPIAVLLDALSFLISAVLVGRVRAPERVGYEPPPRRRLVEEIGEGMGLLWRDRRLRAIAGAAANVNFFGLMVFALLVVYLTRDHDFSPLMIAAVTVAGGRGLAGRCGAGPAGRRPDRPRPDHRARVGHLLARDDRVPGRARTAVAGARRSSCANEVVVGVAIMLFDVTTRRRSYSPRCRGPMLRPGQHLAVDGHPGRQGARCARRWRDRHGVRRPAGAVGRRRRRHHHGAVDLVLAAAVDRVSRMPAGAPVPSCR